MKTVCDSHSRAAPRAVGPCSRCESRFNRPSCGSSAIWPPSNQHSLAAHQHTCAGHTHNISSVQQGFADLLCGLANLFVQLIEALEDFIALRTARACGSTAWHSMARHRTHAEVRQGAQSYAEGSTVLLAELKRVAVADISTLPLLTIPHFALQDSPRAHPPHLSKYSPRLRREFLRRLRRACCSRLASAMPGSAATALAS